MAEWLAALYLIGTGHRILARRYKARGGEIDLVARRGGTIIFVEVKARRDRATAVMAVNTATRRRIETAAGQFLARHKASDAKSRFDLVTVCGWRVGHHRDAWRAGD